MGSAVVISSPKSTPKKTPQRTAVRRKTGLALWMDRVLVECDRASVAFEAEAVHDLRVALRRCRSIADGWMAIDPDPEWKRMKKAGKQLFSRLGELRDMQVMEQWVQKLAPPLEPAAQVLQRSFAEREMQLKQDAAKALREFDRKQWKKWGAILPRRGRRARPGDLLFEHLALERWSSAYALHRLALRNRSKVGFHNLRIGLKRFRYIVENFLPEKHQAWKDDLKQLQDLLGDIHDLDVLWAAGLQVNAFAPGESRLRWQSRIAAERGSRIAKYRERMSGKGSLWQLWRTDLPQGKQIEAAGLRRLRRWASYLDPDFEHAERVAKLALQLYDGLDRLGQLGHPPQAGERRVLQIAALVHNVGRSQGQKRVRKASAKLIRGLPPPLGLQQETLDMAGLVARYQAGPLPRPGQKALLGLIQTQREMLNRLAGILRLSEALDADRSGRTGRLEVHQQRGFVLLLADGYVARDALAETIAGARHLLETVLRSPVLVQPLRLGRTKLAGTAAKPQPGVDMMIPPPETLRLLPSAKRAGYVKSS